MLEKLKELREYEGYTQKDIATFLKVVRSTYAGWESGKDIIPLSKLNDLANFYHTSLDYLVGNTPTLEMIQEIQKINSETVANNLKKFREENRLTQKNVADTINSSQSNIHKYENNKSLITTTYAMEFSKQYNYSLDDLVGRKKNN